MTDIKLSISELKSTPSAQWNDLIARQLLDLADANSTPAPGGSTDTPSTPGSGGSTDSGNTSDISKPSDLVGKLWTVMAPFNKPGATNSPQNLVIAKAEADPAYKSWFGVSAGAIVFKANAGGVHSSGSKYPRSELRELKTETADSAGQAAWSADSGSTTLEGSYSIKHTLSKRPQLVFAQVHTPSDDLWEAAYDSGKLVVFYDDKKSVITLDDNYSQGTKFTFKAVGSNGGFDVYYNGTKKGRVPKGGSGLYWKSGCYLQSNVADWGESADAYGEVTMYSLKVTHG